MKFLVGTYEIKLLMSNKQSKIQFSVCLNDFHCVIFFIIILSTKSVNQ